MYLVYQHVSPSGKVYIGITGQAANKRWQNGKGYTKNNQPCFNAAIKKYGWENFKHEIILDNISESEAKYSEKYLIRWYKHLNMSYNITNGGEGMLGHRVKSILKKVWQYDLNSGNLIKMYERIVDAANELNIDPAVISHRVNQGFCKGFLFLTEDKLLEKDIFIKKYKQKVLKKRVVKLDTNFQVITVYDSICSASNDSNLSTDAIGNAIIRKTRSGEFYWIKEADLPNLNSIKFKKPTCTKVILIDSITKEKYIFNSITSAACFLNYKESGMLIKHAKLGTACRGYYIEYDRI